MVSFKINRWKSTKPKNLFNFSYLYRYNFIDNPSIQSSLLLTAFAYCKNTIPLKLLQITQDLQVSDWFPLFKADNLHNSQV